MTWLTLAYVMTNGLAEQFIQDDIAPALKLLIECKRFYQKTATLWFKIKSNFKDEKTVVQRANGQLLILPQISLITRTS